MTDKRFVKGKDKYTVFDNLKNEEFYELHYRYEVDDMCDKLNKVYEENEQLKQQMLNLNEDFVDLLNELNDENEQLKQLIHTMLTQINTEKIGDPNTLYSARIVFTGEEFLLLNKIWKKGI